MDFGDGSAPEHFFLGDIRNTDGTPWECCPREFLRRAIAALDEASGLRLIAAFEQEFVYTGNQHRDGDAYSLNAFRRQGTFGESFIAALRAAGVAPDSFLAEYGTRQFEVTVAPTPALTAADHAVITREMARAAAHRHGFRASFSPMPEASGVGNGVHIHMSLQDASGAPVTYAATGPMGLSMAAQHFCAGVLHHLPAICAITAPSPVSYLRLTPNRWAPTLIDIVQQDRGAALRVCPVFAAADPADTARQFNFEYRVCDARRQSVPGAGRGDLRRRRRAATQARSAAVGRRVDELPHSLGQALDAHGGQQGGRRMVRPGVPGGLSAPQALRGAARRRMGGERTAATAMWRSTDRRNLPSHPTFGPALRGRDRDAACLCARACDR